MTLKLFVAASGAYEQYSVDAVFTTREKAQEWVDAANALSVKYAGWPGLSCESKEVAARSHWLEEGTLSLDPEPDTQWLQAWLDKAGWKEPAGSEEPSK